MDVVDVAQPEEAGEQAAGQHADGQVQADGQALPDDAAAGTHRDDITLTEDTPGAQVSRVPWAVPEVHPHGVGTQEGVIHGSQQLLVVALI